MDREQREVKLPHSKYKAKIITYFTRGEAVAINNKRWEGVKFSKDAKGGQVESFSPNILIKEQNETLLQGVKQLFNEKNEAVEITLENLNNLPDSDIQVLLIELNKAWEEQKEGKKKSS